MLGTTWFMLWGVLWAVYFTLDGYNLGLGTMRPLVAGNEQENKVVYQAIGPFWDGNQVWLITAGGVTFAAFPGTYAVMFSSLYTALMLLLFTLILRGVAYEFRKNVESKASRKLWDVVQWAGSFLPCLLLGVAFANIFKGVPIDADGVFQGNLLTLLNPYGLAGGILFVLMFAVHGMLWLCIKSSGEINARAHAWAVRLWPVLTGWVVLFLVFSFFATKLFDNYFGNPFLFAVLLLAVAGLFAMRAFLAAGNEWKAFFASMLFILTTALFGVIGLFPALLPSSLSPAWSMTIENSSSSPLTLKIMLVVTLIFVPLIILYQFFVHKLLSHKVGVEDVAYEEGH